MSMSVSSNRPTVNRPALQAGGPARSNEPVRPGDSATSDLTGPLKGLARIADFPSHLPLLEGFGIRDAGAVRFWAAGGMRRMTVAIATGVPPVSLQNLGRRLDLLQIPGMKPDHARLLDDCGVHHPTDMARLSGTDESARTDRDRLLTDLQARARRIAQSENRPYEVPSPDDLARMARAAAGIANTAD